MGSINQKLFKLFEDLFSEFSSETIGIFGVSFFILFVMILFTSISPLLTGVLSDLICVLIVPDILKQ